MTIIAYRGTDDVDVEFEDGTIVKHKTYDHFKNGAISNTSGKPKIGETRINKDGEMMTIVACRSAYDIDVQFEDGSIAKSKRYLSFQEKHGRSIRNPNRFKKEQLKLKFICKNGLLAKIIDYNDSQNISVIFEDGIIVKNKWLKDLRIGNIKNPYFNKSNKKCMYFQLKILPINGSTALSTTQHSRTKKIRS